MTSKLSSKQFVAVECLVSGAQHKDAAKAAGVTKRTLQRWLEEPLFVATLQKAGDAAISHSTRRLVAAMDTAIDTLDALMTDDDIRDTVKVRAATAVLTHGLKLLEVSDIMKRIEELEQHYAS